MTFLPRKLYEPGGLAYIYTGGKCQPLAPHLAGLETDHYRGGRDGLRREVSWAELMDRKRERQRERLHRKLYVNPEPLIVPCYIWTFNNKAIIPYGGWWCYVVSRYFSIGVNRYGLQEGLALSIMRTIPLGFLPITKCFEAWMERFAEEYPRSHPTDRRKAGTRIGWLQNRTVFTVERPT